MYAHCTYAVCMNSHTHSYSHRLGRKCSMIVIHSRIVSVKIRLRAPCVGNHGLELNKIFECIRFDIAIWGYWSLAYLQYKEHLFTGLGQHYDT